MTESYPKNQRCIAEPIFDSPEYRQYVVKNKVRTIYKKDFIALRALELETGKKNPKLEEFRKWFR